MSVEQDIQEVRSLISQLTDDERQEVEYAAALIRGYVLNKGRFGMIALSLIGLELQAAAEAEGT